MENLQASTRQRKASRKTKSKKKPIKVVYISNPMKVKTCASKFRDLVQELTGQGAGLPNPNKFVDTHDVGGNQTVLDATKIDGDIDIDHHHHHAREVPAQQHEISDFSFGSFDDVLMMPQILEDFPGFFPSSLCRGSSQVNM